MNPEDEEPGEEEVSTGSATEGAAATGDTSAEEESPTAESLPPHDETGLDLARSLSRSIAGAAARAPRAKPRTTPGRGSRRPRGRAASSGAHPDDRDPQLLDSTLGRLVQDHGWALDLKVHGVFGRWPEIVGDDVAQHCQPVAFADGRLVVRADSTAWATQLKYLAPTLVRRLNEELGHGSVTVIEIEGPNLPSWKKGRLGTRDGRGPRDTYG